MFMAPTIALYASPPSSVCSSTYQINAHTSCDFDLNVKSSASTTTSTSHKPIVGGLSCLFSSPSSVKNSSASSFGEELGSFRHDRGEELKELSSSFGYSQSKFAGSFKRDHHHSPVSVLQGPVSCSANGSSRSPPMRILQNSSGLFNGFVRSALSSSCIDYDLATFETDGGAAAVDAEELTFSFEGTLEDHNLETYADELLVNAQLRHEIFYDQFVIKAFHEAEKAHRGQRRASGDPYLKHCVETAASLALIGANSTMVAAGLLHDTLDDSSMSFAHLQRTFGADVANLVKSVSKLSELSHLARENNTASKTAEADCMHTMFLAMPDVRAVIIKLADRLHNMATLDALPSFTKQQRFAKETLEIFVPLANRLGITNWTEQLENLCFKHLNPENHDEISSKLLDSYDEAMMISAKEKLEQALEVEGISYRLSGRHKSLYSIHRKMLKKKLTLDEIHDIHGLRLIVDSKEDCYKALRVVNKLWSEVPGKFKDYIVQPKCNGYRSLHAVVVGEGTAPLEVQIRTTEMHLEAEFGLAAHWRYKEGDCTHSAFVLRLVEWAQWVLSWLCEAMSKETPSLGFGTHLKKSCTFPNHSEDCPFSYKPRLERNGPIFVIVIENDKMSVQELPANSTMKDLMDRMGLVSSRWGSPYGLYSKEELRPRLNYEPVAHARCKLEMADVVELTPALPKEWLTEYRERIQRMYDRGLTVGKSAPVTGGGWRN